ncbi:MAG: ABC transporter ATP-binding protein, partial [Methanosarcina sp.]|nr:ABC transporter ATP-binding protein [Methanosarcina sp.]
ALPISHILEIAKEICTSIGIIYRGKLVYTGRLDDPELQDKNLEEFFLELVGKRKGISKDILEESQKGISALA